MASQKKTEDLEKDIFGSNSELSSDEGSDVEMPASRKAKKVKIAGGAHGGRASSESGGEDYIRERRTTKKRKPRAAVDGDDEAPKKKRKKKAASPKPEIELTEEQLRKLELDKKIKDVLKPAKRAKKRTKANEDDLDKIADDYVAALRVEMMVAANEDKEAHKEGIPAVAKLRMLPRVMDTLQKRQYATAIMDQDLLGACKVWLEPLDNKSLPALNIQKELFEHFRKMTIDTETLRESGLGRIVLFYTKCTRVLEPIQRIASELVDAWTRPILKRSASYFDKVVPMASAEDMESVRTQMPKLATILKEARVAEAGRVRKHAVAVPERSNTTYTVAPRMSASLLSRTPGDDTLAVRRNNREMLRRIQRKMEKTGKA